jgi:hypothetical protein
MLSDKRLRRALQVAFAAAVVWYFARQVAMQWGDLATMRASLQPDWALVAESGVVVLASYAALIETWRRTVVAWGERLSWGDAARIWFISNLGRYVPGKVWQIGAMGVLAQDAGVSGVAAVGSSLVVNLVNLLAAALVVLLSGAKQVAPDALLPGFILFAMFALATPWVLPPLARLAGRLTGRVIAEPKIPARAILTALVGCTFAWALYGVAFRLLAVALFGHASGPASSYIAVFTLSYLIGYLFLISPGGIGAREIALASMLPAAGLESGAAATLLIVVSRLWLTVLEAVPGLLLLAVRRPRPDSQSSNVT